MDEQTARNILGDRITEKGLYDLGNYIHWVKGSEYIILDSDFIVEELDAIAWWMRNMK